MDKIKRPRIKPSKPADTKVFRAFLKFLLPRVGLLVETYKFAREIFAKLGFLYYWEEIFNLPSSAMYQPDCGSYQIIFYRSSKYGTSGDDYFVHYVPKHLLKRLIALLRSNPEGLLFQQEDGSPFNKRLLAKEFRKHLKRHAKKDATCTLL